MTCCTQTRNKKNNTIKIDDFYNLEGKKYTKEELENKLPIFINEPLKYDKFYDNNDADEFFNEQKQYEKNELNNFFIKNRNIIEEQIKSEINMIKKNNSNINEDLNIKKLVKDIIYLQDGQKIYAEKIRKIKLKNKKINNFSKNEKINYLTILICGKSGVGKSTLINHILNLHIPSNFDDDIKEYSNNNVPFFKFVKMNLVNQYPVNSFEEKKKIMDYITKQERSKDKNNKVRCIWYCFNNGTLLDEEIELIKSLRNYYNSNIPILLIHTLSINNEQINSINNLKINPEEVIKILAMDYKDQSKGIYLNSFGIDILINETLFQWQKSFLLNSPSIKTNLNIIKSDINDKKESIYEIISEKFINEYNSIKDNDDFIEYIISIFRTNIKFFLMDVMKPESIDRIKNAPNLIKPILDILNSIEQNSKILIEPVIQSYAINFLKHQSNENKNMKKENIRNIKEIENTAINYLYINYNYIFQKNFIYHFLMKKQGFFCKYFKKELDDLSEEIMLLLNDIDFQHKQFVNNIKIFFNLNPDINNNMNININNNNLKNQNYDNDDNISLASNTIIKNNNFNNRMNINIINNANNFTMNFNNNNNRIINNFNNINDNNLRNDFNNNDNINNGMNNMINFNNINNIDNFNNMNNYENINNFNNFNNFNCNFNANLNKEQTLNLPSKTEVYYQIAQNNRNNKD